MPGFDAARRQARFLEIIEKPVTRHHDVAIARQVTKLGVVGFDQGGFGRRQAVGGLNVHGQDPFRPPIRLLPR